MNTNYELVKDEEQLRKAVESLSAYQAIGLDTETTELDPYFGRLRLIQFATPSGVHIIDLDAFRNGGNGELSQTTALAPPRTMQSYPRPVNIAHHATLQSRS